MSVIVTRKAVDLSRDEIEDIRRQYQNGKARYQLAAVFGCSDRTVGRLVDGLEQKPSEKPLSDGDRQRLLNAWTRPHVSVT